MTQTDTTTVTTQTVDGYNSLAIANLIADAVAAGKTVKVDGTQAVSAWGGPAAHSWGNGTVSVKVKAKQKGKFNDLFWKIGATITVSVTEEESA